MIHCILYLKVLYSISCVYKESSSLWSFEELILQLPSCSTLQAHTGAFLNYPGASSNCIISQLANYAIFKEECHKQGKKQPQGGSALIFDEVKVACQLMWNSRSNKLIGLAMSHKEQASLLNIYKYINNTEEQTSYILQFFGVT